MRFTVASASLRQITLTSVWINLDTMRKPNSITVLLYNSEIVANVDEDAIIVPAECRQFSMSLQVVWHLSFIDPPLGGFGEIFPEVMITEYHHWRKYFTESPERRVYKWYIIPKIKNFRKNALLSSSSWTYLREYDALKYKIASSLFIFITRSTENSF